ncbi:MAG: pitrilysin family protein [Ramlibacter sp.]
MLNGLVLAFATVFAVTSSAASAASADIPIPDIPYTQFVLRNGLTLLVHEDHKLPVVAVNTWYHVGSKNETPGKTGFAHLFEHLMFSGSENFNKTFLAAMGPIGATDMNGTTNNDRTNYFENVPTSMLDYALFAESDRMGHLLGVLDQKKLDLQRGVVQNEKRQGENRPYGGLREILPRNTYPVGHPYSWSVIGSMQDLEAASMADVQDWFRTYYGPNNVTLVLAGDITPEAARQKVEKYYGDLPPGPPLAKQQSWIAKRSGTHRGVVQDRVPQPRLYRVWNVPGGHTETEPLLDLAALVLGGGKTSRFYKRLVYTDQLATSATASNDAREIAGQFDVTLTAGPGKALAQLERAADEELQALRRSGPTAAELELAKTVILARYARMTERVGGFGGKSDLLAACMTYTGKPDCYKDYLRRVRAATPASVKQAMHDWLADGDYVLEVQPFPAFAATGAKLDRTSSPALGGPQTLRLPPLQTATLSNGLKLALVQVRSAPIVNLSLLVGNGYASDPAALPGLASLTLSMMEEGTPRRSAARIGEELEALGASFSTGANLDGAFVNMNALKATLPAAIDIYADLVLHPAFPDREFERVRRERMAAIQREKSDPQATAWRVLPALLYGRAHPYAQPGSGTGTEAALARLTREDLVNEHRTWFKPNHATLLVVGDTSLAEMTPLLEKAFAGWKAGDVPQRTIPRVAAPAQPVVYLMDRPGAQQSVIFGAQLVDPATPQELVHQQIVNSIFGGGFSSRMNMNLREDKHWSYGVRNAFALALGQRSLVTVAPVQTDKTAPALQELASEYAGVAGARPITPDELVFAQQRETLGQPGTFETTDQLSRAYATILQYKLPESYYNSFAPTVLAMTPESVNAIARRTVVPGSVVWIVVGDMSKVERGVRELQLGEVRRIDADGNPVP